MIKIKRGDRELVVTKGAFMEAFRAQGWEAEETRPQGWEANEVVHKERPVSKMKAEELKLKAIELGIDLDGVSKVGELRQLVMEALEGQRPEDDGQEEEEQEE